MLKKHGKSEEAVGGSVALVSVTPQLSLWFRYSVSRIKITVLNSCKPHEFIHINATVIHGPLLDETLGFQTAPHRRRCSTPY